MSTGPLIPHFNKKYQALLQLNRRRTDRQDVLYMGSLHASLVKAQNDWNIRQKLGELMHMFCYLKCTFTLYSFWYDVSDHQLGSRAHIIELQAL